MFLLGPHLYNPPHYKTPGVAADCGRRLFSSFCIAQQAAPKWRCISADQTTDAQIVPGRNTDITTPQ